MRTDGRAMPLDDEDEEDLRRWFRDLPADHPLVMVLWEVARSRRARRRAREGDEDAD